MSERSFHLRMKADYGQPENTIVGLLVEKNQDGLWQDFVLSGLSPGFEIFVYSIFTCQHTYFRINAAEQGLVLASGHGEIELGTDEDWMLDRIKVDFRARLASGEATPEAVEYIMQRMRQCPVSKNIREPGVLQINAAFEPA